MATETIYRFDAMFPGALLDFALSLDSDFELKVFDGVVILRDTRQSECSDGGCADRYDYLLATLSLEALVEADGKSADDIDDFDPYETAISDAYRNAVEGAGLSSDGWYADPCDGGLLNVLWPTLEFFGLYWDAA